MLQLLWNIVDVPYCQIIYEFVVKARLRRATEDKLGPLQHGFRKGAGTCNMIFAVRQLIER